MYRWIVLYIVFCVGAKPSDGVPDMTVISEIDEYGINENLKVRYNQNKIYVSHFAHLNLRYGVFTRHILEQSLSPLIHINN